MYINLSIFDFYNYKQYYWSKASFMSVTSTVFLFAWDASPTAFFATPNVNLLALTWNAATASSLTLVAPASLSIFLIVVFDIYTITPFLTSSHE